MARRFTCTDKWEDVWFSGLDLDMKLAWIYILDKCDHAGIWRRNFRNLCFHCNSTKTPEEITTIFKDRIMEINNDKWFIPKFLKFQYPSGLNSNKPAIISVRNKLTEENLFSVINKLFGNDYLMINESLSNDKTMINQSLKTKTNIKIKSKSIDKDIRGEEIIIPEWLPTTEWNLFLDMRKKIKKLPTEHAKKLLIRDLDALRAAGENIAEVLNQSIKFNWQGLFEIKNQNTGSKKFTPIPLTPEEKTEKERYEALSPEEQKREDDRALMKYACEQAKKERERYD